MKKIVLLAGLVFSLCAGYESSAQVNVSLSIGRPVVQERWYGRDNNYYYMPQQGVYYNVSRGVYVYPDNGQWVYSRRLPSRYGNVTYRNTRYVRINERSPFDRDNEYRRRYYNDRNDRHDRGRHRGWDNNHRR